MIRTVCANVSVLGVRLHEQGPSTSRCGLCGHNHYPFFPGKNGYLSTEAPYIVHVQLYRFVLQAREAQHALLRLLQDQDACALAQQQIDIS